MTLWVSCYPLRVKERRSCGGGFWIHDNDKITKDEDSFIRATMLWVIRVFQEIAMLSIPKVDILASSVESRVFQ